MLKWSVSVWCHCILMLTCWRPTVQLLYNWPQVPEGGLWLRGNLVSITVFHRNNSDVSKILHQVQLRFVCVFFEGQFGHELRYSREISSREAPPEERWTMFKTLLVGVVVHRWRLPQQYIGECHAATLSPCHPHTPQQKPKTVQDVPFQTKLCHAELK